MAEPYVPDIYHKIIILPLNRSAKCETLDLSLGPDFVLNYSITIYNQLKRLAEIKNLRHWPSLLCVPELNLALLMVH